MDKRRTYKVTQESDGSFTFLLRGLFDTIPTRNLTAKSLDHFVEMATDYGYVQACERCDDAGGVECQCLDGFVTVPEGDCELCRGTGFMACPDCGL